jgi:hypothetical protein
MGNRIQEAFECSRSGIGGFEYLNKKFQSNNEK